MNFNELLRSDKDPEQTWVGTTNSTRKFREDYVDPLIENKNYSSNELDVIDKWVGTQGKPPSYFLKHRNDVILHTGYDYRNKILKRSLSPVLYYETKRRLILEKIEESITHMVEHIKSIKRTVNYNFDKDYRDFN